MAVRLVPVATPIAGVTNAGLVNVPVVTVGLVIVGVVRVGLVLNTNRPVPVSSVMAARRLALVGLVNHAAIPAAKTVSALMLYQEFVGW